jgi:hypothetical protein
VTTTEPGQPLTDAELAAIEQRHDNAHEDMQSYSAETLCLQDTARDVPRLLAEVDRLRAENARLRKQVQDYHESATAHVAKFDRQHKRLMEAQGRIDAARELHQPITVDWSTSPKCKAIHGHGWVNWPCPDAKALGMDQSGEGQADD